MRTIAFVASLLLLAPAALAVPLELEFSAQVTSVPDGAPTDFVAGEAIGGILLFNSETTPQIDRQVFAGDSPLAAELAPLFPAAAGAEATDTLVTQLFQAAGLVLMTDNGFGAFDVVTEFLWVGNGVAEESTTLRASSGGLLSTLVGNQQGTMLQTISGPATTGIFLDFATGPPELTGGEDGEPETTFASLTDPQSLTPSGGSIRFGQGADQTEIEFEVTDFTIRVFGVPEPHSLALVALGVIVTGRLSRWR